MWRILPLPSLSRELVLARRDSRDFSPSLKKSLAAGVCLTAFRLPARPEPGPEGLTSARMGFLRHHEANATLASDKDGGGDEGTLTLSSTEVRSLLVFCRSWSGEAGGPSSGGGHSLKYCTLPEDCGEQGESRLNEESSILSLTLINDLFTFGSKTSDFRVQTSEFRLQSSESFFSHVYLIVLYFSDAKSDAGLAGNSNVIE